MLNKATRIHLNPSITPSTWNQKIVTEHNIIHQIKIDETSTEDGD